MKSKPAHLQLAPNLQYFYLRKTQNEWKNYITGKHFWFIDGSSFQNIGISRFYKTVNV